MICRSVFQENLNDGHQDVGLENRQLDRQLAVLGSPGNLAAIIKQLAVIDFVREPLKKQCFKRPGINMQIKPVAVLGIAAVLRRLVFRLGAAVDRAAMQVQASRPWPPERI